MPFALRPFRHSPVPFLKLPLAYFLGFGSLITLLLLSRGPVYAEWVPVRTSDQEDMIIYANLDTIRRQGHFVKMWELFKYKTAQTEAGISHLSIKVQFEYDCAEERYRELAFLQYSGNMGRGKVVLGNSDEVKWAPVAPDTIGQSLWTVACSKK